MKCFIAIAATLALGVLGSASFASATEYYCNGQYKSSGGSRYYPNGQYINSGGSRYHFNGQYANSGGSRYYPNGQYINSGGSRYYPNGQYINSGGTRYYPNGQYINSGSTCYYENGQIMGSCPASITTEVSGVRIRVNLVAGELIDRIVVPFARGNYFGTYEMDYATAEISEVIVTCTNDQPSAAVAEILQKYAVATTQEQAQVRERVCR